jgi:S-formylglutathione hydrolase FrmB
VALVLGCGGAAGGLRADRFTVRSRLAHRDLEQVAIRTGAHRPLLVLLHGRSGAPADLLGLDLQTALRRLGSRAPDLLLVNGDDASYYHDRKGGKWGSYVLREAIPAGIRRLGADPRRVAIGGFSMGGFGALDLARIAPGRFCAVGAHSAALWRTGGETPAGAFDDAADFGRHDLFSAAATGRLYRVPVWIDVGTEDPFRAADTAFAKTLQAHGVHARFHVWPGGHEYSYWHAHVAAYLRFYAAALRSCR